MVQRILLAVDGSEGSRKAARFAADLASATRAKLFLLTVLERPTVVPFGPLESYAIGTHESQAQVEAARAMMDEIAAGLPPGEVEKIVEFGVPAEVIAQQAEKLDVDLVVVGSHGHTAAGRFLLGSVSDRVVHHAPRPVTVVR